MKKHAIKMGGDYYTGNTKPGKLWAPVQKRARKFNISADAHELAKHFNGARVVKVGS